MWISREIILSTFFSFWRCIKIKGEETIRNKRTRRQIKDHGHNSLIKQLARKPCIAQLQFMSIAESLNSWNCKCFNVEKYFQTSLKLPEFSCLFRHLPAESFSSRKSWKTTLENSICVQSTPWKYPILNNLPAS